MDNRIVRLSFSLVLFVHSTPFYHLFTAKECDAVDVVHLASHELERHVKVPKAKQYHVPQGVGCDGL
jgi:hypothetical protein